MNARHAFASLLLLAALAGVAFLGVSLGAAVQHRDLALWGHHPLFGSGMASLVVALLGAALLLKLGRSSPLDDEPTA